MTIQRKSNKAGRPRKDSAEKQSGVVIGFNLNAEYRAKLDKIVKQTGEFRANLIRRLIDTELKRLEALTIARAEMRERKARRRQQGGKHAPAPTDDDDDFKRLDDVVDFSDSFKGFDFDFPEIEVELPNFDFPDFGAAFERQAGKIDKVCESLRRNRQRRDD